MSDDQNQPMEPFPPGPPAPPPPPAAGPPPPPPPPTQVAAPPPPPPTAVGVATAAPPPPPAKKSRAWIWFLVIGLVLVCCVVGVIASILGYAALNNSSQSQALSTADLHVKKAVSIVSASQSDVSGIGSSPTAGGAAAKAAATSLSTKIAEAKPEVEAARVAIGQLPASSQVRITYEKGLDELTMALSSMQALSDEALGVGQFSDQVKAGLVDWKASQAKMEKAVHALNSRKFATAAKHAKSAHGLVSNAGSHFSNAADVYPDAEMKQLVAYVKIAERRVATLAAVARDGASGSWKSYNRRAHQYNALNKQQHSLAEPKVLSDPSWLLTRTTNLAATASEHANKADTYFAQARSAASGK